MPLLGLIHLMSSELRSGYLAGPVASILVAAENCPSKQARRFGAGATSNLPLVPGAITELRRALGAAIHADMGVMLRWRPNRKLVASYYLCGHCYLVNEPKNVPSNYVYKIRRAHCIMSCSDFTCIQNYICTCSCCIFALTSICSARIDLRWPFVL